MMKKKLTAALAIILLLSAFTDKQTLKGTWQFSGGVYNNKPEGAPVGYQLQKRYTATGFDSFVVEKGSKPEKYQSGLYTMDNGTYTETETYSTQPSQLTGKTVHYQYTLNDNTLTIRGKLPTGMNVEEYWKKVK